MKNQFLILLAVSSFTASIFSGCKEDSDDNTSGYDCVSGSCVQVSSGASYTSLSECNSDCLVPDAEIIVFMMVDCFCGEIQADATDARGTHDISITPWFGSSSPACGAAGYITFDVKSGSVMLDIYCAGGLYDYSWNRTVNVAAGSCTKVRLNCDETTTLL